MTAKMYIVLVKLPYGQYKCVDSNRDKELLNVAKNKGWNQSCLDGKHTTWLSTKPTFIRCYKEQKLYKQLGVVTPAAWSVHR